MESLLYIMGSMHVEVWGHVLPRKIASNFPIFQDPITLLPYPEVGSISLTSSLRRPYTSTPLVAL